MKRARIISGLSIAAIALAFPAMSDAPKAPPTEKAYIPHKQACEDVQMSVYFPSQESMLSSYSMRALNSASDQLAGCAISGIEASVVSADAKGSKSAAQLSEARAAIVLDALTARGIRARNVRTDFIPISEAHLSDDVALPMARRVDLTVKASPGFGL